MISLFGQLSLWFALACNLIQTALPLLGYRRNNPYLLAFARPGALGQFFFLSIALGLLISAFLMDDFSLRYVNENSHYTLPVIYKLTAAWGAHEGSILLWVEILSLWSLIYMITQRNHPAFPLTVAIFGLISFGFLCFLIFTSNPFLKSITNTGGNDLNPLLQDPGFVSHPPMLYMGYVGFSAAFAITQAALIRGEIDQAWARLTRHFCVLAWGFLTLGIILGSWWSYRVLGWGGFWFWDPVENASLMPWLCGTALLHVLILVEKRNIAKAWAVCLVILAFALSILGTFLVRSGVLISAHNFASDPTRGLYLLSLFAIVMFITLFIYLKKLHALSSTGPFRLKFLSRENFLLLNSGVVFVALLTVLLGTLYPLLIDAFHLDTISVGAPYFNQVLYPLIFLMLMLMALLPWSQWHASTFPFHHFLIRFVPILIISLLLWWHYQPQLEWAMIIALSLCLMILLCSYQFHRQSISMSIAHAGFAVFMIGILLTATLNQERMVRMHPGEQAQLGPYQFLFLDTHLIKGKNYHGIRALFEIIKNKRHITTLYPEKRIYPVREIIMSRVAIEPGLFRDIYMALGEAFDDQSWSVRLYYKPFLRWIWFGGILMILGSFFSLLSTIGWRGFRIS